jgi:hypothetical protein
MCALDEVLGFDMGRYMSTPVVGAECQPWGLHLSEKVHVFPWGERGFG